jgi:hypothetical protein
VKRSLAGRGARGARALRRTGRLASLEPSPRA